MTLASQTDSPAHSDQRVAGDDAAAECRFLQWALARYGFSCRVTLGDVTAEITPGARFAIHLTRSVPLETILRAFSELVGRKAPRAVILTGNRPAQHVYREWLDVDDAAGVVRIRRNFARGGPAASRRALVGVAWLIADEAPTAAPCWQTARRFLRSTDPIAWKSLDAPDPAGRHYFVGPVTRQRRLYERCKRVFDVGFSLAAIVATLPVCIPAAIVIKLYDRGPIFFSHTRESRHGRPFGCLKFRTMVRDADALQEKLRKANQVDGPQFKIARDPRITPIGHFLRRTNIDELPQFLNVLRGHMSVVGPRPSPFEENQLCPAWREARLSVKPGITGLWQVSRSRERGAADFQEWILYDTQYVERRSFWLDVKIILLTIKELFGKGQ